MFTQRDDEDLVFRALADKARREILDLVRAEPLTTGDLAARFSRMTRFGVMKHLGVLEAAGLIVVVRRGRERWNHLNSVPIRRLYRRWLRTFGETGETARGGSGGA